MGLVTDPDDPGSVGEAARRERALANRRAAVARAQERRMQLILAGNERAKGGPAARRLQSTDGARTLRELAEEEVRRQLSHSRPDIRRDAAKLALELDVGKFAERRDSVTEIVYETRALVEPVRCPNCKHRFTPGLDDQPPPPPAFFLPPN